MGEHDTAGKNAPESGTGVVLYMPGVKIVEAVVSDPMQSFGVAHIQMGVASKRLISVRYAT